MNMHSHSTADLREDAGGACIPEHCIRERAYEIYLQRGRKGGHADGDWLTAEAELKELKAKAAAAVSMVEVLTEDKSTSR